ncbi:MAG TPA: response regulator [Ktedonobacterales bacterium]|jgi:CheY-like chemotaxis protein
MGAPNVTIPPCRPDYVLGRTAARDGAWPLEPLSTPDDHDVTGGLGVTPPWDESLARFPRLLPRPNVLVVDDDALLLDLITRTLALELPDTEVRLASTTAEAERAALAWTPDLILCDVRLPDGDGRALLERLRRHPRLARVPSVLMTALDVSNRLLLEEAASLHADFLRKPFDLVDLLTVVERILALSMSE